MDYIANELAYLDGARFCLIYMQVLNRTKQELKLTPVHGTAKVQKDRLVIEEADGNQLVVPNSALPEIRPNDGEKMLGNASHYVIVKVAGS